MPARHAGPAFFHFFGLQAADAVRSPFLLSHLIVRQYLQFAAARMHPICLARRWS
jgi:hypothetical protein